MNKCLLMVTVVIALALSGSAAMGQCGCATVSYAPVAAPAYTTYYAPAAVPTYTTYYAPTYYAPRPAVSYYAPYRTSYAPYSTYYIPGWRSWAW